MTRNHKISKCILNKILRFCFIGILVFSFLLQNSVAQQNSKGVTMGNSDTSKTNNSQTYALIVGVSKYQNPAIRPLEFADKDALAFYNYFKAEGVDTSNMYLLLDEKATRSEIIFYLDELVVNKVKPGDKLYIYFSGHGDVESRVITNDGYLLPYDSPKMVYAIGAINISTIQNYITTCSNNGGQVFLIADACHAGNLAGGVEGLKNVSSVLGEKWKDAIKILSCQSGELSLEGTQWGNGRGLFSYVLINGMAGLADNDSNSIVNLRELSMYLMENVPKEAKPSIQNPLVNGNLESYISSVNVPYLREIGALNDSKSFAQTHLKGFDHNLNDSTRLLYQMFNVYMDSGIVYRNPALPSAYSYFIRIPENRANEVLYANMKRNLSSGLMSDLSRSLNSHTGKNINILRDNEFEKILSEAIIVRKLLGDEKLKQMDFLPIVLFSECVRTLLNWRNQELLQTTFHKLDTCLELNPNAGFAFNMRGQLNLISLKYEQSIQDFKRAIDLSPKFVPPYLMLAHAYTRIGDHDASMQIYKKVMELDSSCTFMALTGIALDNALQYKLLTAHKYMRKSFDYNNSLSDNKQKASNLYAIGWACHQFGYLKMAIKYYKKELEFSGNDYNTLFKISSCYAMKHKKQKTLKYLEKAFAGGFNNSERILDSPEFDFLQANARFVELLKVNSN